MAGRLDGLTVAFLAADGVEQVEYVEPRKALEAEGASVHLLSPGTDPIQAMNGDIEPADTFTPDRAVGSVDGADYDALVLPGGTVNPDKLRVDDGAVSFVRDFVASGKPVGAICHGPWTLVEADVVRGRTLTSYPSLTTDIRNAGGHRVDEEVVVDSGLVTSRDPGDLDVFCSTLVDVFAGARRH
ncbi:type 1 glutamine amidotransferase domain-containing protein [Pseudokineococcus marinus]|uniref:Type 1 glutamine amidotransferase n=1 Tax=Pseudokineococcus marinus TaxID=351215 RepID=A0A849BTU8_9ACTN|nr:type 1 glutamine amidotransferase domain-containing protein [Pseudokineococcus marinus]NNH24883.1 type 1 glutamine amidotransferase [Pseudokineococcus marinus]